MSLDEEKLNRIRTLAKAYGATRLILFGSALETAQTARDLDLACDGIPGWKIYEFGAKLEEMLRAPVDVVPLTPSNRFTVLIETRGRALL